MQFAIPERSRSARIENIGIEYMNVVNANFVATADQLKSVWRDVWNPHRSLAEQQELVDYYVNIPAMDFVLEKGVYTPIQTNAMDQFFNRAERTLRFLALEVPDEFTLEKCPYDVSGDTLPDFPECRYQMYFTAGWKYRLTETEFRMIEPCNFG